MRPDETDSRQTKELKLNRSTQILAKLVHFTYDVVTDSPTQ